MYSAPSARVRHLFLHQHEPRFQFVLRDHVFVKPDTVDERMKGFARYRQTHILMLERGWEKARVPRLGLALSRLVGTPVDGRMLARPSVG